MEHIETDGQFAPFPLGGITGKTGMRLACTAMPSVWFSSRLSRRPLAVEILQLRQPLVEVRALLPDLVQPNCLC